MVSVPIATLPASGAPWSPPRLRLSAGARRMAYAVGVVIAAAIAGLRLLGPSPDFDNYRILHDWIRETDWVELLEANDPAYLLLSKLADSAGASFDAFLMLVALVTCAAKAAVVARSGVHKAVLVGLYVSYLYWLHDYTQVRFGLALALVLAGIYAAHRSRWLLFVAGMALHASTLLPVVMYAIWRRPRWALAAIGAVVGAIVVTGQTDEIIIRIGLRIAGYIDQRDAGVLDQINVFSLMPPVQALMTLVLMRLPQQPGSLGRLEIGLSLFGVASFYALQFLPVMAFRTYEMFIPFFLILVARNWHRSSAVKVLTLGYLALGLRSSFFAAGSLVPLL